MTLKLCLLIDKNSFNCYILPDQVWWCNVKLFLSYPKNYICKFMQVISRHKLFNFHLPFWIWIYIYINLFCWTIPSILIMLHALFTFYIMAFIFMTHFVSIMKTLRKNQQDAFLWLFILAQYKSIWTHQIPRKYLLYLCVWTHQLWQTTMQLCELSNTHLLQIQGSTIQ